MAKGPDDLEKLTESDKKNLNDLEKEIDDYLVQNYKGRKEINIPIKIKPNFKVRGQIKLRYQDAGWKTVKFEWKYNYRNKKLNYLKLSKKEIPKYNSPRSSGYSFGYGCDECYPSPTDNYWHK